MLDFGGEYLRDIRGFVESKSGFNKSFLTVPKRGHGIEEKEKNMNDLITVPFNGDYITVVRDLRSCNTNTGRQIWVAVKPVSDRLGLDWSSQVKRIKRHKIIGSTMVMMTMVADDGKQREMLCLPSEMFHGWLVQIDLDPGYISRFNWRSFQKPTMWRLSARPR